MSHYVTIRFDFSDTSKYASIPLYIGFPATFIPFFIYIQSELSPLHPGLGMHDTRVSDTRKRLTGLTAQEETNTDTYKEKKYKQKTAEKKIQKNNGTAKEQTQEIEERRQAVRKTRSKPQPDKPVKGRCTLY